MPYEKFEDKSTKFFDMWNIQTQYYVEGGTAVLKVVIVDSGINKTHKIFEKSNVNISSLQYKSGEIICSNKDNDLFGHGTAIAGIISRENPNVDIAMIGINDLEEGLDEDILIWVLNYICETQNADIVNLSLGLNVCDRYEDLYNACKALSDKGTIIISAFDNSGAVSYPAAFDNVIGVITGATVKKTDDFEFIDDDVVNVTAKGGIQRVAWTQPEYIMIGGNSFACAHVTAKAAKFLAEGAKSKEEVLSRFKEISIKQYATRKTKIQNTLPFDINKVAIFPFNKEMHSLIRYSNLLPFEISEVYDTKYSATVGATTSHLMKDNLVENILIKNISDVEWDNFDTLILGHTDELSSLINKDDLRNNLIEDALKRNKKVYSFDEISRHEDTDNVYYPYVSEKNLPPNRFGMLYRISKPVLGIFGTSSRQGKFTLQLKIRQLLTALGYDVGQIGTEPSSLLYGMDYVFPMGYNSSVHIKEFDTVMYLNYIINDLCTKNKDIILVGSQSGTVVYDTGNIAQFNIPQYNFLIGTQPDAVILCVNPYDETEYIRRTIRFIESCINDCKVIALVMFPMDISDNWTGIYGAKKPLTEQKYLQIKASLVTQFHIPIFKLGEEKDMYELTQNILNYF